MGDGGVLHTFGLLKPRIEDMYLRRSVRYANADFVLKDNISPPEVSARNLIEMMMQ